MGDMLIVTDSEGRIKLVNRSVSETLGVNPDDLDGQQIWVLFTESESQRIREELDNLTTFGSFESCFITSDEREIPVVLSFSGLESGSEGFEGRVFVASNITDQKIAEKRISDSLKEKEVLLSEIHHRVKNNLAVISGLLEMQIWNLSEEDVNINPLKESQLRIQSIALVHELLYKSEDFSEVRLNDYVDKLLNGIAATHKQSGKSIQLKTALEPISITIQKAIPASLMLNELVVNAYKHAFNGQKEGSITIKLNRDSEFIRLTVLDNGQGLPEGFDPFTQTTLGMTLINTLVQQLDAELLFGSNGINGKGAVFTVRFKGG
jgi:PAS domain S-box-containing protein